MKHDLKYNLKLSFQKEIYPIQRKLTPVIRSKKSVFRLFQTTF
jgi:hypothetical protein